MSYTKWFIGAVAATLVAGTASADVLIDPDNNNGSFEFAGGELNTTKIQVWDGTPDVDNWTEWTENSTAGDDSGIENTGNASDGAMVAFLQGGNAVYNMTSWEASEGDFFFYSWDHVLRADRNHTVGLVYDNNGTITSLVDSEINSTGVLESIDSTYTIPAGSPAIGNTIGLGVVSPGDYPEVDNFILTVNEDAPVPGDVDGDGDVDLIDYQAIRDNFRLSPATKAQGDLVGADIVDLADFLEWRNNHPFPIAANIAVPEPAAALLLVAGLGLISLVRTRRP